MQIRARKVEILKDVGMLLAVLPLYFSPVRAIVKLRDLWLSRKGDRTDFFILVTSELVWGNAALMAALLAWRV